MTIEVTVFSDKNTSLLTNVLTCEGSATKGYPEGKGETVGSKLLFITRDAEGDIVEDRSYGSMKGCVYFEDGECLKGKSACPVAAVMTTGEFSERIRQLKRLKRSDR